MRLRSVFKMRMSILNTATTEIDLTGKQAGDTIRVADLPIATTEGIHLKTNPEETVVQVTEVHNEVPEDEETETEEE